MLADPGRLRASGLTLQDLIDGGGGVERRDVGRVPAVRRDRVRRPRPRLPQGVRDIENTVIRASGGTPVLVRNVAKVVESYTPRRGAVARGEAIDSVEGTVLLRRGENPKDVLARRARGGRPDQPRRPAGGDEDRPVLRPHPPGRHHAQDRLAQHARGGALVSLVLWLFLRAVAGSLAVAVTMPLALLAAFVGLHYAGVPANLLSMGAIDFGILLDGAVILVENAYRHLAEERPPPEQVPRDDRARPPRRWCGRRCSRCRSSSRRCCRSSRSSGSRGASSGRSR